MKGKKIVALGEIMMRLSPNGNTRFSQAKSFEINFGGAEANVSVFLSKLLEDVKFISKVPDNPIGHMALDFLKGNGVNTENVILKGDRLGVYYLEKGTSVRGSKVLYDRENSAMASLKREEFKLEEIFKGAELFHVSGITVALGDENIKFVKSCIEYCKNNSIKVSVDLNYRSKLWGFFEFTETMKEIIKGADIVFGWIDLDSDNKEFKCIEFESLEEEKKYFNRVFKRMNKELGVKAIATTLRENISSSRNAIRGIFIDESKITYSNRYEFEIIDRVGAGDAFSGGVLYNFIRNNDAQKIIEFGTKAGVYKHTVLGDVLLASKEEIDSISSSSENFGVSR